LQLNLDFKKDLKTRLDINQTVFLNCFQLEQKASTLAIQYSLKLRKIK